MQRFTAGCREYVVGARDIADQRAKHRRVRSTVAAQSALRPCAGQILAMRTLRAQVEAATRVDHCQPLSDVAVIDLAVHLVHYDRLYLYEPLPRAPKPGVMSAPSAAPAAAARPPAAASPSTRQTPVQSMASSFGVDLDAGALATSLREAAQDGTPFCEECARAARAA